MASPASEPSPNLPGLVPSAIPLYPSRALTRADIPLLSRFSCCAKPDREEAWEKDVNDWIKAPPHEMGALFAVESGAAEVWLYLAADGKLIGYSSLGAERILLSNGTEQTILLIPYVGLATAFQNYPDQPKEAKLSRRIMQGLIQKAAETRFDDLFLYVDPNNPAFQYFYPKFGFQEFSRELEDGREWILMRRPLRV